MARPTKQQAVIIEKRNKEIMEMVEKGYPMDYIYSYFSLSKARLSQIIKRMKKRENKNP